MQKQSVIVALSLVSMAGLVGIVGCAETKRQQLGTAGVSSVNNVSAMLTTVSSRIRDTVSAAEQLEVQGVDRVAARSELDRQTRFLGESADAVRAEAARMRSLGDGYFDEWERELDGGSTETSVEQAQRYEELTSAMGIAGENFEAMTQVFENFLENTTDSYSAADVSAMLERVRLGGIDAQNAISALQVRLDEITSNYRSRVRGD